MQVIPASQQIGACEHVRDCEQPLIAKGGSLQVRPDLFDAAKAVTLELAAGEISIHDSYLIHGAQANTSDIPRCGLALRYSRPDAQCDLQIWPDFNICMVRGKDTDGHNPTWHPPQSDNLQTT